MSDEPRERRAKKTFQGKVVSNKCAKTILVLVETQRIDKAYRKIIKKRKKFMAHDPNSECQEGDFVTIQECRPISKRKSFILKSVDRQKEIIQ